MVGSTDRKFTNMNAKRGRYGKKKSFKNAAGSWDSKDEYRRYLFLQDLQRKGTITELETKVVYRFDLNGVHIAKFKPDFRYKVDGVEVVEDYKGNVVTRDFKLRCKMAKAFHGVDVIIVQEVTDMTPIINAKSAGE